MTTLLRNHNLWILFIGSLVATTGTVQMVTLGGIIGERLTDAKALATLPVSFKLLGVVFFALPAAMVMRRIGRRMGFVFGALLGVVSQFLAVLAIYLHQFWLFTFTSLLFGCYVAFGMQQRFAATEAVSEEYAGRAVSFILAGAIGGAILGPFLAKHGVDWLPSLPYAGGLLAQGFILLVMAFAYLLLKPPSENLNVLDSSENARAPRELIRQPLFMVAVLCGVTAYFVMSLIMTATPLSMHVKDGFSMDQTSDVIRAHVLGMYIPAIFTGYFLDRFGIGKVIVAGLLAYFVCYCIALAGHQYLHYWWALILLGVGWNFLFTSGTTLLTKTYKPQERFTAQAINETSVFGMAAGGSLLAGVLINLYGWFVTVGATIPMVIILVVILFSLRKSPELKAVQ